MIEAALLEDGKVTAAYPLTTIAGKPAEETIGGPVSSRLRVVPAVAGDKGTFQTQVEWTPPGADAQPVRQEVELRPGVELALPPDPASGRPRALRLRLDSAVR